MKLLKKNLLALVLIPTLMSCSEKQVGSETTKSIFTQLEKTLPTASTKDTERTRSEVGIHRSVFYQLCWGLGHCQSGQQ